MSDISGPASVTEGSVTVTSTSESESEIREGLAEVAPVEDEPEPEPEPEPIPKGISKAASKLGKLGGQAAAEARKAKESAQDAVNEAPVEEPEPEPEPEPEKLGKPRHDPKARMLEATRKEAEAKREAAAAKAEADQARKERDELRARLEPAKPQPKAPEPEGKPQLKDFTTYEEWVEATIEWKAEAKFKERETKAAQETQVKQYMEAIDGFLGKSVTARKEYEKVDPDWYSKLAPDVKDVANRPDIAREMHEPRTADNVIADEIILADKDNPSGAIGPRLMLHLSDHPDEFQRIRALTSSQAVQVEMRILARSLNGAASTATSPRKEASKAPTPIRPVIGGPNVSGDEDLDDDAPLSAYVKRWGKRELASSR